MFLFSNTKAKLKKIVLIHITCYLQLFTIIFVTFYFFLKLLCQTLCPHHYLSLRVAKAKQIHFVSSNSCQNVIGRNIVQYTFFGMLHHFFLPLHPETGNANGSQQQHIKTFPKVLHITLNKCLQPDTKSFKKHHL